MSSVSAIGCRSGPYVYIIPRHRRTYKATIPVIPCPQFARIAAQPDKTSQQTRDSCGGS